jgi:hypothetical protein
MAFSGSSMRPLGEQAFYSLQGSRDQVFLWRFIDMMLLSEKLRWSPSDPPQLSVFDLLFWWLGCMEQNYGKAVKRLISFLWVPILQPVALYAQCPKSQ